MSVDDEWDWLWVVRMLRRMLKRIMKKLPNRMRKGPAEEDTA